MRVAHLLAAALPLLVSASMDGQTVLNSPPHTPHDPDYSPLIHKQPTLADLLTIEPSASIWYSYARDTMFSRDFDNSEKWLTLVVPTNEAVMSLGWKPHQGPPGNYSDVEMSEQEFDERSKRNVERWVAAHIIPSRVSLSDGPVEYQTRLEGKSVVISPIRDSNSDTPAWAVANNRITSMREGLNGVVYLLNGTIDA